MSLLRILKILLPARVRSQLRSLLQKLSFLRPAFDPGREMLEKTYRRIGILNYQTSAVSGEEFLIRNTLPALVRKPDPVLFDIGANVGDFTLRLLSAFPAAAIHAFEPSPQTYLELTKKVSESRVHLVAKGLSDRGGTASFFDYADNPGSQHGTLFGNVFIDLHKSPHVSSFEIELTTLDDYCQTEKLILIDFVKIDTEGNELAVLKGAKRLIATGGLPIIQFEFNQMNIISGTFLKDFYRLLDGYQFFRLMPKGLLPLGSYESYNEIFAFQNILCVRSEAYAASALAPFQVAPLRRPPRLQR